MSTINPFKISFGVKPSNFINRLEQSDYIIETFSAREVYTNAMIITGPRGSGKTVMLSNIASHFKEDDNWLVVELIPSYDMLEQLASKLYDSSLARRLFDGKTFGFSFQGFSLSIKGEKPITNVTSLIEILLSKLKKKNKRLLILVDEIAKNDYVRQFAQTFQLLLREQYDIFLLSTGLYNNIYELQNDKTLTFLYRSIKISLDPLNLQTIAFSYQNYLKISEKVAIDLAKLTKGYAFAYQVVGFIMLKNKYSQINEELLIEVDQYLKEYTYDKTWSELSANDRRFLMGFHNDGIHDVKDLLIDTKMDKKTFSIYRDRLIKKGLINNEGYGKLSLSLPRFYNFIKNKSTFSIY